LNRLDYFEAHCEGSTLAEMDMSQSSYHYSQIQIVLGVACGGLLNWEGKVPEMFKRWAFIKKG